MAVLEQAGYLVGLYVDAEDAKSLAQSLEGGTAQMGHLFSFVVSSGRLAVRC
jgi:hypothetical protein